MSMYALATLTVATADIDTPARRRQLLRWLDQNRKALTKPKSLGPFLTSRFLVPHAAPLRSVRAEKY